MSNIKSRLWKWNYWAFLLRTILHYLKAFKNVSRFLFVMKKIALTSGQRIYTETRKWTVRQKTDKVYSNENWRRTVEQRFTLMHIKYVHSTKLHRTLHANLCGFAFLNIIRKKCMLWSLQHFTVENIKCMRCRIVFNFQKYIFFLSETV